VQGGDVVGDDTEEVPAAEDEPVGVVGGVEADEVGVE
jgi:hypothetical protein